MTSKLEFHYTPRHGSWLNMVEIEFSVLARQCLHRWVPDMLRLKREVRAWEEERNKQRTRVDWRFTMKEARSKLHRPYPQ